MLTGTGIQIGSATNFGASIGFPRGLVTDGSSVWLFDANFCYTLDISTGIATRLSTIDIGTIRGSTYHDSQILVYDHAGRRINAIDPTTGNILSNWSDILSYPEGLTGTPDLWGIASLDDVLYGVDRTNDILVTIPTTGQLSRVGTATQFGVSADRIQSLTAYNGELIGIDIVLDNIISINTTTGVGTLISSTNTLPDLAIEALVEFDGMLYAAGGANDALYRLYDVLWDETIDDLEVDEGVDTTWDLSDVSQDAETFSLTGTVPSWLSISGTELVATGTPDVSSDTTYAFSVRASRDSVNVDKVLRVVVSNITTLTTPDAPTSLSVSPNTDGTSVDLSWTAPDDTGGSDITDYEVSSNDGTDWTSIGSTDTSYTLTGLDKGTEYTFVVRAVNSQGEGTSSSSVTETTETTIPDNPTNIVITPQTGGTSVSIEFDEPSDTGGTPITRYETRTTIGTTIPNTVSWLTVGNNTEFTLSTLEKGTTYAFQIRARNSVGTSDGTDVTTFTTLTTIPDSPTDLTIDDKDHESVDVSWTVPDDDGGSDITDYEVRHAEGSSIPSGTSWVSIGSTSTSYTFTDLEADTQYTFSVRAVNSQGESESNDTITETTDTEPVSTPDAPTSLSVSPNTDGTSVDLSWTAPEDTGGSDITDYEVSSNDGTDWTSIGSTDTSYTLTGLDKGTEYTFVVRAVNSQGEGTSSSSVTETTETTIPDNPTDLTIDDKDDTSVDLSWTVPEDTGGEDLTDYEVRHAEGSSIPSSTSWVSTGSTSTSYTFTDLDDNTQYTFSVRAVNSQGESESNDTITEMTDRTLTTPNAPTNLTGTKTTDTVDLTWTAPSDDGGSDITDYEVRHTEGSSVGGTWVSIGSTDTSFEVTDLEAETQYTFSVRAVNSQGEGTESDGFTVVTRSSDEDTLGYRIQVYDKNWKNNNGSDGTLDTTLTYTTHIRIQERLNRPNEITFQVPRGSSDADEIQIGRIVRVIDSEDTTIASGVIVGPLDRTRPLVNVLCLDKSIILNNSLTPYEFQLESTTAIGQIRELLKNYLGFRQTTDDDFNDGELTDVSVLTVAGDPDDEYFVVLDDTDDVYEESGTFVTSAIKCTHDILGDPSSFTRLRYLAELGNDTNIKVRIRSSNNSSSTEPENVSGWSVWSSEYDLSSENTHTLGLKDHSISSSFRWIQIEFTLETDDTSITPALQSFEIICEYDMEITAGSTFSLSGAQVDKTFDFVSHLDAIREIVSLRNAEFRVNDDYELEIDSNFGSSTPSVTFTVGTNCNVIRYEQEDDLLSTSLISLSKKGTGLTKSISYSSDDDAYQSYGFRPYIYVPVATTDSQITTEISDELDERTELTLRVIVEEQKTTTPLDIEIGDIVNFRYQKHSISTTLRVISIHASDPKSGIPRQFELISHEGFFAAEPEFDEPIGVTGEGEQGEGGVGEEKNIHSYQ